MHISHEIVCQAWELLRVCPPFKRWKLPKAEEIEFHIVTAKNDMRAEYKYLGNGRHRVTVNTRHTAPTLTSVLQSLAHEAAHLRQQVEYPRDKSHHGNRFWSYAKQICKDHHWSIEEF